MTDNENVKYPLLRRVSRKWIILSKPELILFIGCALLLKVALRRKLKLLELIQMQSHAKTTEVILIKTILPAGSETLDGKQLS